MTPELAQLLQDPEVIDLLADRIAEKLAARLDGHRGQVTRPLSFREAAARLGIDRNTTLRDLVADRRIRTVTVAGKKRIPVSEVERVEQEGTGRIATANRTVAVAPSYEAPNGADEARAYREAMKKRRGGASSAP